MGSSHVKRHTSVSTTILGEAGAAGRDIGRKPCPQAFVNHCYYPIERISGQTYIPLVSTYSLLLCVVNVSAEQRHGHLYCGAFTDWLSSTIAYWIAMWLGQRWHSSRVCDIRMVVKKVVIFGQERFFTSVHKCLLAGILETSVLPTRSWLVRCGHLDCW